VSLKLEDLIQPEYRDVYVVGIDPGETTGVCIFKGAGLLLAEQLQTKPLGDGITVLGEWLTTHRQNLLARGKCVCSFEDYRVYGWKADQHKFAELHTPKLIGALVCLLQQLDIEYSCQMAVAVKPFFTDEKLQAWGLYKKAKRHSRDAIRHALYRMAFYKREALTSSNGKR
jgi:hypothetical protein